MVNKRFVLIASVVLALGLNFIPLVRLTAAKARKVWTTTGLFGFNQGTLADGGVNTYVAADGTVRLVNLWDLNNDGFPDLVFPDTHDNNQQIDLYIYWGVHGFNVRDRTRLPSNGGVAQAVADLNGDGYPDLVVVNEFNGVKDDLSSYIYWGAKDGFSAKRRTELPTYGGTAVAVADLNHDGHPDLVFANSGKNYDAPMESRNTSYIYWGSAQGFSVKKRTELPTAVATDVKIADLNGDGAPDIVFANEGGGPYKAGLIIYWGTKKGEYSAQQKTSLPGERSSAVAIADLNHDGIPDLVLANRYWPIKVQPGSHKELDTDVDTSAIFSTVYWGSSNGYQTSHKTDLPTVAASAVCVGDLNRDGFPDIVFANGPSRSGHSAPSAGSGSYIYWGGPTGYEVRRRTTIPTLNPTGCLVDDLNKDGYQDLAFSNSNDAHSYDTYSYIYWGGPNGVSADRRLELPTLGAASVGVADFNNDGKKDVVFINRIDGSAGDPVPAYIYWGNEKGNYTTDQRFSLFHPFGSPGEGYAAADLNNDGYVDLYMGGHESAVYWGSQQGFSSKNKTVISPHMAFSARAADFNHDGYLDLVLSEYATGGTTGLYWGGPMGFSQDNRFTFDINGPRFPSIADLNGDGYLDVVFPTVDNQVVIYWGGPDGFDNHRKSVLPAGQAVSVQIADLNGDGHLDIIVCNLRSPSGSPEGDTDIYWGSAQGYSASRRQVLPSMGNESAAVADLNGDGHLDLVLTSYHAGETRSHPSYIYWGSQNGFHPSQVTLLATNSASGALIDDFNNDGNLDILFACHTREGSHRNDSFLYWGGPNGFSTKRRTLLPALGPHMFTSVDIGNVYNRSDRFDYLSKVFDAGSEVKFQTLSSQGDTPFATQIEFQVRAANTLENLRKSPWLGPDGPKSYYTEPKAKLNGMSEKARYCQFKATLVSPNGDNTPVLRSVSIEYSQ